MENNYQMNFLNIGSTPQTWPVLSELPSCERDYINGNEQGVKEIVDKSSVGANNCYNESSTGTTSFRGKKTISNNNKKEINKRHRLAFQTRSHVDVLDDGYRWRKYGQKTVKNSKFPRSYYKCTFHGCNVKKQIQRLCNDEGVVVTTYEGIHSHPTDKSAQNFDHILKHIQTSYSAF